MKINTFVGIITYYERITNSRMGNPRYFVIIQNQETGETIKGNTQSDAKIGYILTDYIKEPKIFTYHKAHNNIIFDKVERL